MAEHLADRFGGLVVPDLAEDFLEEALREQFLGDGERDAAGAQVEKLGGVDLAGRRAVRALHVVGFDLEAREGVGLRVRREQEVAVGLVGVGALGVGGDLDQPREDGARLAQQGVGPFPSSPEQFATLLKSELVKWANVVRDAKIPRGSLY